jgi:hypothetical protein
MLIYRRNVVLWAESGKQHNRKESTKREIDVSLYVRKESTKREIDVSLYVKVPISKTQLQKEQ